jgi:hypothetical protein
MKKIIGVHEILSNISQLGDKSGRKARKRVSTCLFSIMTMPIYIPTKVDKYPSV